MKHNEQIFEVLSDIKEEYIDDAMNDMPVVVKKNRIWPAVSAAAVIALIISVPLFLNSRNNDPLNDKFPKPNQVTEVTTESAVTDTAVTEEGEYTVTDSNTEKNEETTSEIFRETGRISAEIPNLMGFHAGKDRIMINGYYSDKVDNIISSVYNAETAEETRADLGIPDLSYIFSMYYHGDDVYIVYRDTKDNAKISVSGAASGEIKAVISPEKEPHDIAHVSDGELIAYRTNEKDISRLVFDAQTLALKSDTLLDYSLSKKDMYISSVLHDSDNNDYLILTYGTISKTTGLTVIKINSEGSVVFSENIELEQNEEVYSNNVYINNKGNICVVSSEKYMDIMIRELNSSTGKTESKKTSGVLEEYVNFISTDDGSVYYYDSKGIWQYDDINDKKTSICTYGKEVSREYTDVYNSVKALYSDGNFYLYCEKESDEGTQRDYYTAMDYAGNKISDFTSEFDRRNVLNYNINNNGDIYVLACEYGESEFAFEPESYRLDIYSSDGTKKSSADLTEAFDGISYFYAYMDFTNDGDIILCLSSYEDLEGGCNIFILAEDGRVKGQEKVNDINMVLAGAYSEKGIYLQGMNSMMEIDIRKLDEKSCKTEKMKFGLSENSIIFSPVGDYDFCYSEKNKIYGFYAKDNKSVLLHEFDGETGWADTVDKKIVCLVYENDNKTDASICVLEENH